MGEISFDKVQNRIWQNEKLAPWLNRISYLTFYLGLLIELAIVILDKSAYTIQYEGRWFQLTFVLFGISLITTRHSLKEWLWLFAFGIMGVISYLSTDRNEILRFVEFVWACSGKDMKKALKFTFWFTSAGCVLLVLLSILGIAGEVAVTGVFRVEEETRYCFGMGHPNAFHCMILAVTWLGVYCYHEKIKWQGYALIGLGHIVLYLLTDSRSGLLMSLGSLLVIVALQYCKKLQDKKWTYIIGILIVVGAVGLSILIAKYTTTIPLFEKMDEILTGRISSLMDSNRWEGMTHTWSLWSVPENNYFFDMGIVRMFYWFGIIPAVVYFLAQCRLLWCGYKNRDYMLLAIVISITIYTIFEAHYISDYIGRNYILFFMGMYLTDMLSSSAEREEK